MPEQRSATPAVPPPLPGRARTPVPTLAPASYPAPPVVGPASTAAPVLAPAPVAAAALAPAPVTSPAPVPAPAAALPSAEEAEATLAAALRGAADADPTWCAAAERVVAALSEGERTALSSGPLSFDPGLLRAAAGMRLRLELGVALVPSRTDLHGSVLPALLGEVDDLLLQVKAAAAAAPPGAAEALEPVRLALVDGGVALAGALARVGPAAPPPQAAAPFVSPSRPAPRVLSNVSSAEAAAVSRGGKAPWVALAVVVAVVGAYHGWRLATRPVAVPPPALGGAPAHTTFVTRGELRVLTLQAGQTVDAAELERFRAQQREKGNDVRELAAGIWVVEPAAGAQGGAKP